MKSNQKNFEGDRSERAFDHNNSISTERPVNINQQSFPSESNEGKKMETGKHVSELKRRTGKSLQDNHRW